MLTFSGLHFLFSVNPWILKRGLPNPHRKINGHFAPMCNGAMDKKAGGVIWLPFLQFLSNFNETLSISLFFRGRLNHALRFDLIPLHSAHFTTAQRGLCTDFQTFLFIKVESWFFVCGIEFRFHNILIHYFFTYRVRKVRAVQGKMCTLCTL